jgi:DNA-binding CsgD family transcriptional regulator
VLAGHDDAEIAKRASISRGKLDACFAQVFERLGVRNRLELALLLVQSGF